MTEERAVLAGGCFWGMEELLRKIPGVIETEVGYAGGKSAQPTYSQASTGTTGHAEAVRITFDPRKLSFEPPLNWTVPDGSLRRERARQPAVV